MARTAPKILLSKTDLFFTEQVVSCEGVFAVLYKGNPFQLKSIRDNYGAKDFKYKRTVFVNHAHAYRLADRLNQLYGCDDFTVSELTK